MQSMQHADINALTDQLNYAVEERQYEYTAVAIVKLDIPHVGITIMDGPFLTLLPYGKTGNFLLYCVDHSVIAKKTGYTIDPSWLNQDQRLFLLLIWKNISRIWCFCKHIFPL